MDDYERVHRELRQAINVDRRRRLGKPGGMLALICECGSPTCHRTVLISPEDYDRRSGPLLHSEHDEASAA